MLHIWRKSYLLLLGVLVFAALIALSGCATVRSSAYTGEVYVDTSQYGNLIDYGEWNVHTRFGRVWRPYVSSSWRPFYYGHWVWSHDGWLWISYEPFGWITCHHGHWYLDPYLGWVWVPGYRWSPAVVIWMHFGDHIGWAPMPPPGVIIDNPWDRPRVFVWNFVNTHHFPKEYVGNYAIRTPLARPIDGRQIVKKAPDVRVIERNTNTRITPVPIEKKRIEVEKKTYRRTLVPQREAEKIKRHAPDVNNILKRPPAAKQPAVKKPHSADKD